jgi:hypothetical protein
MRGLKVEAAGMDPASRGSFLEAGFLFFPPDSIFNEPLEPFFDLLLQLLRQWRSIGKGHSKKLLGLCLKSLLQGFRESLFECSLYDILDVDWHFAYPVTESSARTEPMRA